MPYDFLYTNRSQEAEQLSCARFASSCLAFPFVLHVTEFLEVVNFVATGEQEKVVDGFQVGKGEGGFLLQVAVEGKTIHSPHTRQGGHRHTRWRR